MKKLILALTLFATSYVAIAQVSPQEKKALTDFYTATQGENWANKWNLDQPVSEWSGVTVENNKVTSIRLLFNNLTGTIPSSIGDLDGLRKLELSFNNLHGELPVELGKLNKLEVLAFNGNDLTGSIPSSLGDLSNLKQLHVSSNQLTGEIPASIGKLNRLEVLNVFDNDLSGAVPSELAALRNLKELMVAENNFKDSAVFSTILLANPSFSLDLNDLPIVPDTKSIIAIETEEEN